MSCCDDSNPVDFTLYQNTVFGPTDDALAPSIYYRESEKINGVKVPVDLTGYSAKMSMRPISGGADTLTLVSSNSPPLSCLILNGTDGTVAPYFAPTDVTMAPGQYNFDILLYDNINTPFIMVSGIITVKNTVTKL